MSFVFLASRRTIMYAHTNPSLPATPAALAPCLINAFSPALRQDRSVVTGVLEDVKEVLIGAHLVGASWLTHLDRPSGSRMRAQIWLRVGGGNLTFGVG